MADSLGPVPPHMDAQLTHDGVTWRYTPDLGEVGIPLSILLLGSVAAMAATLQAYGVSWAVLAGASTTAVGGLLSSRVKRSERVVLTDRTLTIEVQRMFATERTVLRLDDLQVAKLTMEGTSVVFRSGDTVTSVGGGQPREHVAWFAQAIAVALGEVESREQAEGREYTFMRKAPEALEALKEPPAGN